MGEKELVKGIVIIHKLECQPRGNQEMKGRTHTLPMQVARLAFIMVFK